MHFKYILNTFNSLFHLGADKPITFQRDNVYENVSKIIKIYDCKYRINRSDSNWVIFEIFLG